MALAIAEKASLVIGAGIGAGIPPVLERMDAQMAIDWVKKAKGKDPESYPLYYRPGIMVPGILGPILLGAALLADKQFGSMDEGSALQAGILVGGTGLTVGAIDNLATALDGRKKAGVPMFTPDPTIQYSTKCAWRSIGGPGYLVGCLGNAADVATNPIVDPPYDTGGQIQPSSAPPARQPAAPPRPGGKPRCGF
jgi:hypothetical protein